MTRIGIDASNISGGGGVTHLVELLQVADPNTHGFSKIVLWSGQSTLSLVSDRPWLIKINKPSLNKGLFFRAYWQRFKLSESVRSAKCDVLFVPGGSYAGNFHPVIGFSRNLLPFEWRELRRFGWSWITLKLILLRFIQSRTFHRSDAMIFLTNYAQDVVTSVIGPMNKASKIIPHGVNELFRLTPRKQLPIDHYSVENPFRIIYVSEIAPYKHQWHVAEAVIKLRKSGIPVLLVLIGGSKPESLIRLYDTINRFDPNSKLNCVSYLGKIPHDELHGHYKNSDLCLFASSCENMPNILIEGMASGLPIACSKLGPMPEVIGEGGLYFHPEQPSEIEQVLRKMIASAKLRNMLAKISFEKSIEYSWKHCADETFGFIKLIADQKATRLSRGKESL